MFGWALNQFDVTGVVGEQAMVAYGFHRRMGLIAVVVGLGLAGGCGDPKPAERAGNECSSFAAYQGHEGEKVSTELLTDPDVTFRFDGSDMMPPAVGVGSFWRGMTDWINGKSTATVLSKIESTWPD